MQPEKIAVSGIGGGAGQSIVKALYDSDYTILGLDGNVDGTGLYAVPQSYQIPYATRDNYIESLKHIFQKESCQLMFPGLDAELKKLAEHRAELLLETGTRVIVSSPEVVEIADNKLKTAEFLSQIGLPSPETYGLESILNGNVTLDFPFIIKPKTGGARSKNVFKINNQQDLDRVCLAVGILAEEFVAQQYIEGDEYTCGTVSFNGDCLGVIVMRRILRDGDTYKCFVEFNPAIEDSLKTIIAHLKPFGPLNIQLRLKDGIPYVFELNARCSGTTAARALCGFNEPKFIANYLLRLERPSYQIRKVNIFRYWKELVVQDGQLGVLEKQQYLQNPDYQKL